MAELLLFHHAQGRTSGVEAFAEEIRRGGHVVHLPDLYDGRTFDDLDAGVGYAGEVGFQVIRERGVAAAEGMPERLVYAGISLGVMPAQQLAQTRPGAAGAVLIGSCVPPDTFGGEWPAGVPVQIHGMERDPIFADEGDLDAAREIEESVEGAELFLYPGDAHLFVDGSLAAYDGDATSQVLRRIQYLLDSVG